MFQFVRTCCYLSYFYLLSIFIDYLWWNIYCLYLNGRDRERERERETERERERERLGQCRKWKVSHIEQQVQWHHSSDDDITVVMMTSQLWWWCHSCDDDVTVVMMSQCSKPCGWTHLLNWFTDYRFYKCLFRPRSQKCFCVSCLLAVITRCSQPIRSLCTCWF